MKIIIFISFLFLFTLYGEELKVLSENFRADQPKGVSIFTGKVVVTKGLDELNASKVTIYTDSNRKPTKMVAEGDVSFYIVTELNEKYRGKSQRAVYLPNEREYQFYTKVDLIRLDDFRRVKGDKVVVNTIHGHASADSANNEPVMMVFTLQDSNTTKKGKSK
ncbi:MAG: lipopolysaccharide transport periplasmic protein LptA [Sulfuricurvum sp.]|nr:lipopolysaccharide transport periplasmic protein LptA [Sulfuricurvum sp.]MDP3021767.1 lipopolysaccharide transport periplasmic protein LptA [Sulfuricurvum sp.]